MVRSAGPFDAVVLAAGLSSRMDGFKPLYPLGGGLVIERVIGMLLEAGAREVVAVIGHQAEVLAPVVASAGARAAIHPNFAQGMFSSIQAGARALRKDAAAFFVLPADIPLVRMQTVRRLMRAWTESDARVLHPRFLATRGHPPLLSAELTPSILDSGGSRGLRGLLEDLESARPGEVLDVAVADANILADMDTEPAYREILRRLERLGTPDARECAAIMDLAGTPERTRRHGEATALAALTVARGVNAAQPDAPLDLERIEAAAKVHDLAKGQRRHEEAGGEFLRELGFTDIAQAVAGHKDMAPNEGAPVSEAEVVFIADKLTAGTEPVTLEERYARVLERHAGDLEACDAIRGRLTRARRVLERIEERLGGALERLVRSTLEAAGCDAQGEN
ncbi:MAG: hypothetical protein PWQ57_2099 [Desulfovibrionales bacterium]|nr:hypothetical protein [Desulfovibrionales bacterium]